MTYHKTISVLFAISMVALWSCSGASGLSGQPAAPMQAAAYPAECVSGPVSFQQIMRDQTWLEIKCTCAMADGRLATWYNTVRADRDPTTFCQGFTTVISVPAGDAFANALGTPVFPVATATVTVTSAPPPPPLPTVIPFPAPSTSVSAVTPVPTATSTLTPVATASASAKPSSASLRLSSKEYKCDGKLAQRKGLLVTEKANQRTSTTVVQQCVGSDLVCLTSQADQQNFDKPPCGCKAGKHLQVISDSLNTWACYDDKP